ncbi:alpha/beta hydrolase [Allopontixanthobacter sp.]|uniref:alpha/beta fold hydrolase n=1 Tax=Allopontixanthobacter sp. TaxID=2906452 RepID=UPI002ABAB48E|nr:alpha/beta hydrolase [Allopontixanthobacter sp.]MDZ4308286.1 alpha/beta hydrolase [Allopontixanthobacter sp.]
MQITLAGQGEALLLLHGFPDSAKLWRKMIPGLVDAGFQVIAPDQRGFGETTAPAKVADYSIDRIAVDAIALLDTLGIERAGLVGHDWGAVIGWRLAADHPERFSGFVALSVGHPKATLRAGFRQKLKSWYFLLFLLRGIGEAVVRAADFKALGWMTRQDPEMVNWRRDLSRPGRLTAGMNWYRANIAALSKADFPPARIPVLGLIGSADVALGTEQMRDSADYADVSFRCEVIEGAGHWLPLSAAAAIEPKIVGFLKSVR